ncbi:hypothetical protein CYLTODRAFT_490462 [Cylindrobasidium torrendii FP15055 ss-10]|uniref:SnoaL-like domain-containing protein n=1 Tax=Cylindrobasidium torrendii FP15055 ss-10 TaxID=1314674 RepID=A0A0D7BDH3_9AGAR|nr:hypothetical protein CYLTODRAFT_490462 [Cylindrobasidium torrendii FP15055 ss-10]
MAATPSPYERAFRAFLDALSEHDFAVIRTLVGEDFQILRAPKSLLQPTDRTQVTLVPELEKIFDNTFPKGHPKYEYLKVSETKDAIPTVIAHVASAATSLKGNPLRGEYVMFMEFEEAKEGGGLPKIKKLTEFLDSKVFEEFFKVESTA